MEQIMLYTDGACSGNPGPGGWCAVLKFGTREKIISGAEKKTTNNRMELTAVIKGLEALKRECEVTAVLDSKYVCDAVNLGWLYSWEAKNWKKSDNSPVVNPDLWKRLLELLKIHRVKFIWIKGHTGHLENERCDKIAVSEYRKLL